MSLNCKLTLVLGHAASGKSRFAEKHAIAYGYVRTYVATARILDKEMQSKVVAHRADRGADWALVECDRDLARVCSQARDREVWLIDCATMWLTNLMMDEAEWRQAAEAWIAAMAASPGRFVVVSNDVGGGVTPDNALARRFQREQGALNQMLAEAADGVALVTAGLPQWLK
ncbi:bifunctional adenosylcobinamide kinase/adenosylcobinamide-phosphate guanylyltransferase [Jannaschia sp. KMU-145]|uniref:bifunctional adenosylcobinamide kinase/adenosylcobinamide-phosphate guanylyltransferase n=1 Tax=Jannaschia halovivens TaxID=3388667 RepID=UPI00396B4798